MIMRKSKQGSHALWSALVLALLAGCGHLATGSDFSTPLCVTADDHALRAPTFVGSADGSSEWMLTDFRHVDAYQRYRQIFDRAGKTDASLRSDASAAGRRGGHAASFSCRPRSASNDEAPEHR